MKFGLFLEWPNPTLRNWKLLFEEGVQQIQYSEELGFDYCLIAEHHFSNYGNSPSPLMQALYIGQRTKRIGIGTASLILPEWQPLRLAEEVAVVDNLIDGRLMCGVGRGHQPYELGNFGVDIAESRDRFSETLDVLIKAWTSDESFTYDGQYVKIPNPVRIFPKPMQRPHPPLMVTGTSVESMKMAAERDMMPITAGMLGADGIRAQLGSYIRSKQALGKPIDDFQLGLQCMTHVAPTDEEARAEIAYPRWQNRANRALNRGDIENGRLNVVPYEGELDDESFADRLYFGSPETLVEKFKQAAEVGVTHISNWMNFGGMEHEKLMRSIRLMGEEVLPALRDIHPPKGLSEQLANEPDMTTEELQRLRYSGPSVTRGIAT